MCKVTLSLVHILKQNVIKNLYYKFYYEKSIWNILLLLKYPIMQVLT